MDAKTFVIVETVVAALALANLIIVCVQVKAWSRARYLRKTLEDLWNM